MVTFFHQLTSANDALKLKQELLLSGSAVSHKLIMDVLSRWNSTHAMLETLIDQTPAIFTMVQEPFFGKSAVEIIKSFA